MCVEDILDEKLVAIALGRINGEIDLTNQRGDKIQCEFLDVQNDIFFSGILHVEISRCNRVV